MVFIDILDHIPMVRQLRHVGCGTFGADIGRQYHARPIRAEMKFLIRMREAAEIMRRVEVGLTVDPVLALQPLKVTPARRLDRAVDQLP